MCQRRALGWEAFGVYDLPLASILNKIGEGHGHNWLVDRNDVVGAMNHGYLS